ncbi:hypothetical protein BH10PSE14_BH10PSE14_03990 [soil metagenome]
MNRRDKAVLDYLMLTTYQKRRQAGEIWASVKPDAAPVADERSDGRPLLNSAPHGRERRARVTAEAVLLPLPSFLPYRLGAFATALDGGGTLPEDPLERLALLLCYVAAPLRWEPLNAYHHHYGAASPRSLTICDLYLAAYPASTGTAHMYRYLPDHHSLVQVGTMPPSSDNRSGLSLFIVGNLARSATPYGDFSACIAALEAGGLAAQIALMARVVGWSGPAAARPVPLNRRAGLGLTHWSQIVFGQVDLDGCNLTPQLDRIEPRTALIGERALDEKIDTFSRMRRFVTGAGAGTFRLGPTPANTGLPDASPGAAGNQDDILQVIRRRSSGLDNDGSPVRGSSFSGATLAALVTDWCSLMRRCLTGDLAAAPLSISLAVLNGEPGLSGQYRLRPGALGLERLGPLDPSQLRSFSSRHYWEGVSFVASFSVDPWAVLASSPHAPFTTLHAAAGAGGHALSIAAARRGLFARPIRAYTEFALGRVTPANELMVLQLVCGFSRRSNLRFDLI